MTDSHLADASESDLAANELIRVDHIGKTFEDMRRVVSLRPGERVTIAYDRAGQRYEVDTRLGEQEVTDLAFADRPPAFSWAGNLPPCGPRSFPSVWGPSRTGRERKLERRPDAAGWNGVEPIGINSRHSLMALRSKGRCPTLPAAD